MDADQAVGLVGGILGSVIGIMGGIVGTYFGIKNTKGPKERVLTIRLAALCSGWLLALPAWFFLMPRPWSQAAILWSLPLLLLIPWMNRWLARARAEDESEA